MAIKDLDVTYEHLPQVFDLRTPPDSFDHDFVTIPIGDPAGDLSSPNSDTDAPPPTIEDILAEELDQSINIPEWPELPPIDGGHPGAPFHDTGHGGKPPPPVPPPDALAFYLPFHLYYPHYWGIYLLVDGVRRFAYEIRHHAPRISSREAIRAARRFLFYHEFFHHQAECFALRLETTHRQRVYLTGVSALYRQTYMKPGCLEEGLAEAHALRSLERKPKTPPDTIAALATLVEQGLPGYNRGVEFRSGSRFKQFRSEFAEQSHAMALPRVPAIPANIWNGAPHLFAGIMNVRSRVNYLLPASSPLAKRVPLGRPYRLREFCKQLEQVLGARHVPGLGSKHDVWESADGKKRTTIPRHARGVPLGTQHKILRDLGYTKGLTAFYRS